MNEKIKLTNGIKISIILFLFVTSFVVFKLLENPILYKDTLNRVICSYVRDDVNKSIVWKKSNVPYYYMDTLNTKRWDGVIYYKISKSYYDGDNSKYAFFPLFPLLWKISKISVLYIGFFNYLIFGLSILLLFNIFLDDIQISTIDKLCVFVISLVLPPIVVNYLPYSEALFIATFSLAAYGLIKQKYWLYFIAIFLFAMSRPLFVIIGLSFILTDLLFLIRHKSGKHFLKELFLKLLPLFLGTFTVFFMFYLNSGSFFKYFESIHKYWNVNFSIPKTISDWSIESFGMNVFTIFFVLFFATIYFIKSLYSVFNSSSKQSIKQSLFNGDKSFVQEYLIILSIIYFFGVFSYILFYQGGSLNGLNRYVFASPFFYIFLLGTYTAFKDIKLRTFAIISFVLFVVSLIFLTAFPKIEPTINFNDFGFFILFIDFIFLHLLSKLNNKLKVGAVCVLVLFNIVWMTYLYNIYLCDGYIFT